MATFGAVPSEDDSDSGDMSALDFIAAKTQELRAAQARSISLRDPRIPWYELVCEVPANARDIERVTRGAAKVSKADRELPEGAVGNAMLLAAFCRRLRVRGQDVTDGDGSVFALPALQERLGVASGWQAVRHMLIVDGGEPDDMLIGRLALRLLRASGVGDDGDDDDGPDPI